MNFDLTQINALKSIAPNLSTAQEGGYDYIYIEKLQLPDGCQPNPVDALLCPCLREGYESTLFLSSEITGCPQHNWNRKSIRIMDRNWFAISWKVPAGLSLRDMLLLHINAFRK